MAAGCILILAVAEIGDICFSEAPRPTVLRYLFSATAYSIRPAILFAILLIKVRGADRKLFNLNLALLFVNAAVSFSSVFFGTVFSFDEANHFSRGILASFPFIVSGILFLEFFYFGVYNTLRSQRQEALICVIILSICVISVVVETVSDIKGLVAGNSIASVVFYYMFFLVSRLSRDELTYVYLRSRFFSDVERVRKTSYVISFDLNGLKNINDRLGHYAGDRALCDFADAVLQSLPAKASAYRIGGDEFAVLYTTDREKNVYDLIFRIRKLLEGTSLSFSAGYAPFSSEAEFSKAFENADNMMYEEKRRYYLGKRSTE